MSQTIDNRIVEMQFDNKDFEKNAEQSLNTIEKLKSSLKFDDAAKNLNILSNASKNFDLNGIGEAIERVNEKFSTMRLVGLMALSNVVDGAMQAGKKVLSFFTAPISQIKSGGWSRAANLENAQFQLQGILKDAGKVKLAMDSVNESVNGTAYSLDQAAMVSAQFAASGVQLGDEMTNALKAVAGVAAQTNSGFSEIGNIFATVKGQGKLMTMQLRQLEARGMNAAAELAKYLNTSEANVRDMVAKGKISFEEFSDAMFEAFGENAAKANDTFDGALSNVKAALSRIGAEFATPFRKNAIPVLNQVRLLVNAIKTSMSGVFEVASGVMMFVSNFAVKRISNLTNTINKDFKALNYISNALKVTFVNIVRIFGALREAFRSVFPKNSSVVETINKIAKGIETLSLKLYVSDKALNVFKVIATVVFKLLKSLFTIISKILKVVGSIVTVILKVVAVIVTLVVRLGQVITNLIKTSSLIEKIKNSGGLLTVVIDGIKNAFSNLKSVLSDTGTVLGKVANTIKNAVMILAAIIGGTLYLAFTKIKEIIQELKEVDPFTLLKNKAIEFNTKVAEVIAKLKQIPVLGKVISGLEMAFISLGNAIKKVSTWIKELAEDIKENGFSFDILKEHLMEIPNAFIEIKNRITDSIKGNSGIVTVFGIIKEALSKVTGILGVFIKQASADIKSINVGRLILIAFAFAVTMLAFKANKVFEVVTGLMNTVSGAIKKITSLFDKPKSKLQQFTTCIVEIAGAITILVFAIKSLTEVPTDKLNAVTNSLLKLVGLVAGLALVATILGHFLKVGNGFGVFSANMLIFSVGALALVGALRLMDTLPMDGIWKKVAILGAIAGGLAVLSIAMAKFAPSLTKGTLFMLSFSVSILLLTRALKSIAEVDFSKLQGYWKELAAILVGLGIFARLASGFGAGTLIGLLGFILAFKVVLDHINEIKPIANQAIAWLKKFLEDIKQTISNIVTKIKETGQYISELWQEMSNFDRLKYLGTIILRAIAALSVVGAVIAALVLIGRAGAGLKKAAAAFVIFGATIAGLIYICKLMGEWMAAQPQMEVAMQYMIGFIAMFAVLEGLAGHSDPKAIKAVGKIFLSFAAVLAVIAGVMFVLDNLKDPDAAFSKVMKIVTLLGIIGAVIEWIGTQGSENKAGFGHFAGVLLLFGGMVGTIAWLMIILKTPEDYVKLGVAVAAVAVLCFLISRVLDSLSNIKVGKGWAPILALAGGMLIIAGAIMLMANTFPKEDGIKKVVTSAAVLGLLLAELVALSVLLEKYSKKFNATKTSIPAFKNMLTALGVMIAGMVVLAAAFKILDGTDPKNMFKQSQTLALVLLELAVISVALAALSKKIKPENMLEISAGLIVMVALFAVLALVFRVINDLELDGMLAKSQILMLVLFELGVIFELMGLFGAGKNAAGLVGVVGLAAMVVIFGILAVVFRLINDLELDGMLAKSQILMLVLFELGVIYELMGLLFVQSAGGLVGVVGLAAMVVIFGILAVVFRLMNDLELDGMLAKSQILMLVLFELGVIYELMGLLFVQSAGGLVGVVGLAAMVVIFGILAVVFRLINDLELDGMLAKSQILMLVLVELAAILELMGLLVALSAGGLVGVVGLIGMVVALGLLVGVLRELDTIPYESVVTGLNIISDALNRLLLAGLEAMVVAPGLIALSTSLLLIGVACLAAGAGVMMFANGLQTLAGLAGQIEGIKSVIIGFFTSIGEGVATMILTITQAISVGITNIGIIISTGLVALEVSILTVMSTFFSAAIPILYQGAYGIGEAIVLGFRDGVGWHSPPSFVGDFLKDTVKAFKDGIKNILNDLKEQGKAMAKDFLDGFRDFLGWHSNPDFVEMFMGDTTSAFDEELTKAKDLLYGFGEGMGLDIADGLFSTEGQVSDYLQNILSMFNLINGLSRQEELEATIRKTKNTMSHLTDDMETHRLSVAKYNVSMKENQKILDAAEKELASLTSTTEESIEANYDLAESLGKVGGSSSATKSELEELRDSLKSTIESQFNIFDKFEEKQAMSKDELLSNMRSQIKGVTEWAANINKLSNMGIEQGLLQKLTEMGPEGRDKVAAFASMTATELAEANQLWVDSLTITDMLPDYLINSMQQAGMNVPLGLQQGIVSQSSTAVESARQLGLAVDQGVKEPLQIESPSQSMYEAGMNIIFGLTNGINYFAPVTLYPAVRAMAMAIIFETKNALQAWGEYSMVFYEIGAYIVEGLRLGIEENAGAAIEAATALAIAIAEAFESASPTGMGEGMIGSPSPVFRRFGAWIDEGLALGIQDKTGTVVNSVEDMATEAINSMKSTIATISSMVNDEFEDPVITPILDLSNVRAGARTLSNAFSTNQALLASASMSGLQNGQYSANGPTFIQNNYSPKSLSRKEIYRDSRNLVSKLKAGTLA